MVLFPRLFESLSASSELGGHFDILTIGMVDSNILSNYMRLPVPSNDDSFGCVNLLSFLFLRNLFSSTIFALRK
jgi:ribosomal protein S2